MLNAYQQQTQRLLNDEANELYNLADLTVYINIARGQIASQSETLLFLVTATLTVGQSTLSYSALALPTGAGQSLSVRKIFLLPSTGGRLLMEGRPWQWFENYYLTGSASTATGSPAVWASYQQGSMGVLYFNPLPVSTTYLVLDVNCTPAPLALDTDPELLSYPWTDAVPYYAAYLALINSQRADDAGKMLQLFDRHMAIARTGVTPETLPKNFPMKGANSQGGAGG